MRHLSQNIVKQLAEYQLAGNELLEVLSHIEVCDTCREKVPVATEASVLQRLKHFEEDEQITSVSSLGSFWNLRLAAAMLVVVLVALSGLVYWQVFSGRGQSNQIVALETPEKDMTIDNQGSTLIETSDPITEHNSGTTFTEKPLSTSVSPSSQGRKANLTGTPNRLVRKRKLSKKAGTQPLEKTKVKTGVSRSVPSAAERESLNQFLSKTPDVLLELRPVTSGVRGTSVPTKNYRPLTPLGEVIRETSPIFVWEKIPSSTKYQFYLMDENNDEVESKTTTENKATLVKQLSRGKQYQWKIIAETPEGEISIPNLPNPPVQFKVASSETIEVIDDLKARGNDWRTINFLLNKGMLSDGESKLKEILKKNPTNKLAKELLQKVQKMRGGVSQRKSPTETNPAQ